MEKKLDSNYTRMLRAILNKSWRQHPTKQHLYGHLPPITKTIQVKRNRLAGLCRRSRGELISTALLWNLSQGRAKAGRPDRTYIQQLCVDTGCCLEDLPEAMDDAEGWRERVREICAGGVTLLLLLLFVWYAPLSIFSFTIISQQSFEPKNIYPDNTLSTYRWNIV